MDWFSLASATTLLITFVVFVLMVAVSIGRNQRSGERHRAALKQRLERMPLAALASRLGLSVEVLVHQLPLVGLRRQMRRCNRCDATQSCATYLDQTRTPADAASTARPDFCPNIADLQQLRLQQALSSSASFD